MKPSDPGEEICRSQCNITMRSATVDLSAISSSIVLEPFKQVAPTGDNKLQCSAKRSKVQRVHLVVLLKVHGLHTLLRQ